MAKKQANPWLWMIIVIAITIGLFIMMSLVYRKNQVERSYGQGFEHQAELRKSHQDEDGEDATPVSREDRGPGLKESEMNKNKGRNYETY